MESETEGNNSIAEEDICTDENFLATQPVDDRILKDVVAYVEVRSTNDNRSKAFSDVLQELGARVTKKFSEDVTHVIFKEGSKRTKLKAQKKGIHLVSVLWVDSCKQSQEHVSERMYPAVVPDEKTTPLAILTKLKKAKSMQPVDFEEELARSTERLNKKKKKLELMHRFKSGDSTPYSSPRLGSILVQDTQPRSPFSMQFSDEEEVLTPARLTIPDTPPSMREYKKNKEQQLNDSVFSNQGGTFNSPALKPGGSPTVELPVLQRQLFNGNSQTQDGDDMEMEDPLVAAGLFVSASENPSTSVNCKTASPGKLTNDHLDSREKGGKFSNSWRKSLPSLGAMKDEEVVNSGENKKAKTPRRKSIAVTSVQHQTDNSTKRRSNRRRSTINVSLPSGPCRTLDGESNNSDFVDDAKSTDAKNIIQCHSISSSLSTENENLQCGKDVKKKIARGRRKSVIFSDKIQTYEQKNLSTGNNELSEKETETEESLPSKSDFPLVAGQHLSTPLNSVHSCDENKSSSSEMASDRKQKPSQRRRLLNIDADLCQQLPAPVVAGDKPTPTFVAMVNKVNNRKHRKRKIVEEDHDGVEPTAEQNTSVKKKAKHSASTTSLATESTGNENLTGASSTEAISSIDNSIVEEKTMTTGNSKKRKGKREARAHECDANISSCLKETSKSSSLENIQNSSSLSATQDKSLNDSKFSTLGMSMSAVFGDTFSSSGVAAVPRPSIDEFNLRTRLHGKKHPRKNASMNSTSSSDSTSDSSSSGTDVTRSKKSKFNNQSLTKRSPHRPSLVMTSLHTHEQDLIISIVKKLGGFFITDNVTETTTHVICGGPRRTLNIMYGICRGCWVLRKDWVLQSLEQGQWLPESEYEVTDWFPTVMDARLLREQQKENYQPNLFSTLSAMYVSQKTSPPRNHLVTLIRVAGGQVTSSATKAEIVVGNDFYPDKTSLSPLWILDCITQMKLLPTEEYLLGRPKRESSPEF